MNWIIYVIIAAFAWTVQSILFRAFLPHTNMWIALLMEGLVAITFVLAAYAFIDRSIKLELSYDNFMLFLAALASIVGYVFFMLALKYGEASRVVPLVSAINVALVFVLAVILLGEGFNLQKLLGVTAAVIAIVLLTT